MSTPNLCDLQTAALEYARRRFRDRPDWLSFAGDVEFYCKRLLGPDEARRFFRQPDYQEVRNMAVQLAMHGKAAKAYRMITVRTPIELHQALKDEADRYETSLNRLCTGKLLRAISDVLGGVVVGDE